MLGGAKRVLPSSQPSDVETKGHQRSLSQPVPAAPATARPRRTESLSDAADLHNKIKETLRMDVKPFPVYSDRELALEMDKVAIVLKGKWFYLSC